MATVTEVTDRGRRPAGGRLDERLGFRGPIQRVLVRPEIGALVGTTAVWVFFWAVAPRSGRPPGRRTTSMWPPGWESWPSRSRC